MEKNKRTVEIKVVLDKEYNADLTSDLKIDKNTINEELIKQPSNVAWYAVLYALAVEKRDNKKLEMDVIYSTLYKAIKDSPSTYEITTTSEASLANTIYNQDTYVNAKKDLISADRDVNILHGAMKSWDHRKDLLVTICANLRQEWGSNMSFKERSGGQ